MSVLENLPSDVSLLNAINRLRQKQLHKKKKEKKKKKKKKKRKKERLN